MADWVKLNAKLSLSEDFAEVANRDPLAAMLFLMGLAQAAPWGVLPAKPSVFRAKVCPLLDITLEQVGSSLGVLRDHSMITLYQDRSGRELLYYNSWLGNQDRRWDRTGEPEFDLPHDWQPSPEIISVIERFRAVGGPQQPAVCRWREFLAPDPEAPQSSATPGVEAPNTYGTPGLLPESVPEMTEQLRDHSRTTPGVVPPRGEESRVENDSNTFVRIGENDAADCTSSLDPIEEKRRQQAAKARRDADRIRQQTEQLDAALAALSQPDRTLLDTMLAGQEQAKGKPLTLLQQKMQVDIYTRELAEHGPECWRACCQVACEKGIYTAEYARGCTKNWVRPGGNGNGHGRLPPQGQLTELDRMQIQADREREEATRRGDQRTTDGTRDPRPAL